MKRLRQCDNTDHDNNATFHNIRRDIAILQMVGTYTERIWDKHGAIHPRDATSHTPCVSYAKLSAPLMHIATL